MKALILNSGLGHRMGVITKEHPKCMTEISAHNTILSRQLRQLVSFGIEEVVMTTGYYDQVLVDYCKRLHLPLKFTFVNNPEYGTAEVVSIPEDCEHTTATVRATPNLGHVFGYWKRNGAVVSYSQEYTFYSNSDSYISNFIIFENVAFS